MPKTIDSIGSRTKPKRTDSATHNLVDNTPASAREAARSKPIGASRAGGFWYSSAGILTLIALGTLMITGLVLTYSWRMHVRSSNNRQYVNSVCTNRQDGVVSAAVTAVNLQDKSALEKQVDILKANNHYLLDQNCLAPSVWLAIMNTDVVAARSGVEQLRLIYDLALERGTDGAVYTSNPDKLSKTIDTMQTQLDSRQKNSDLLNAGSTEDPQ